MGMTTAGQIVKGSIVGNDLSLQADVPCETMRHAYVCGTNFGKGFNETPVTKTEIVRVATGAGVIQGFHAMAYESGSSASVTFDLKKNGTSVLSGAITVNDATGDRTTVDGTVTSPNVVKDDVLTIVQTVSTSTGMQGTYAWLTMQETAAPV